MSSTLPQRTGHHALSLMLDAQPRTLYCYRLTHLDPWDEESVWSLVQSFGGHLSIRGDCIDFWVPVEYTSFFVIKYPLARQPALDYL
jgi:hypothetical protein